MTNVYYDAVAHAVLIDESHRITTVKMPADVVANAIIEMITSPAFLPVIEGILTKNQMR